MFSMVAAVGVITPTLQATVLSSALIPEAAPERAVEPDISLAAGVLDRCQGFPLRLWDAFVVIGLVRDLGWLQGDLVGLEDLLGLLGQSFLPSRFARLRLVRFSIFSGVGGGGGESALRFA